MTLIEEIKDAITVLTEQNDVSLADVERQMREEASGEEVRLTPGVHGTADYLGLDYEELREAAILRVDGHIRQIWNAHREYGGEESSGQLLGWITSNAWLDGFLIGFGVQKRRSKT